MLKRVSYFQHIKMDLTKGDGRGMPNQRQATHAARDEDGDGGKKKRRVADLEFDVFHNPELLVYPRWEQQSQPWSVVTAMKYVGFPHFDRLWPPTSHEQHCKSKDAKCRNTRGSRFPLWHENRVNTLIKVTRRLFHRDSKK